MEDFLTIHKDEDGIFWFHHNSKFITSKKINDIANKAVECLKEGALQNE